MWHLKTSTMPVMVGALSMIKKGKIKTWTRYISGPTYMKYIKTALCENAHLLGRCDWKISH